MKKTIIKLISKFSITRYILTLFFLSKNYLKESGWNKSVIKMMPVDAAGNPIPWFTISAIEFLKDRLTKELSVFEYGSGNSTIWLSGKIKNIVSVEHDEKWFENVKYLFRALNNNYVESISETSDLYDVIIIDGRNRVECSKLAPQKLTPTGVIIWDNSERLQYQEGISDLLCLGFKKIDFYGLLPCYGQSNTTTLLYRQENCLGV